MKVLQHVVVAIGGSRSYSVKYVVTFFSLYDAVLTKESYIACMFVITSIVLMIYGHFSSIVEGVVEYSVTGVLHVGVSWTQTTWSTILLFMKDCHPHRYIASASLATILPTPMYPVDSRVYTRRQWNVS